ncbi:2,3,4,5-tetrahydropyridine-2-carboxylate N-succinyltransferase DapD [Helicobacter ailurogastricus]|uniref:2,3,4,5-tetrahydropyridine-2,6-carboxylate N-succinyltransferase n=1 Tax=Helicobacter ailurogastricus TaxID=1578720 RepID=UPI00244D844B|nr:2,3,4,5-tetrahydropyridine-2,6-carboxylate N-succinyltransferase [Helicobacter ailurogastricus]GMB89530.1 2,3,4,5-tetrahydropyridine-2-carboxylate N-succinyltransferase DapD [Helicobacter ailurogastricus]
MQNFKRFVDDFQNSPDYKKPLAFGIAKIQHGQHTGKPLSATYPVLNWGEALGAYAVFMHALKHTTPLSLSASEAIYGVDACFIQHALELFKPFLAESLGAHKHPNVQVLLELQRAPLYSQSPKQESLHNYHFVVLYEDKPCQSLQTAYMKLLALSLGKAPLRSLNLEGIFGLLPNVAWSGNMAYELEYLRTQEIALKVHGTYPCIDFIDKFPRYLMQVLPAVDNIRLLDTAKARFGAYLGKGGYTQMPGASYINFNAGVQGACMNEGRISSSVVVGEGTDIGGGASVLGVLSGGNSQPISIGKNCLLGANSVLGISLGDGCILDAGIGVLAGTIFEIAPKDLEKLQELNPGFSPKESGLYKGVELSGLNGLHFRQNSQNGKMCAMASKRHIPLNTNLHH